MATERQRQMVLVGLLVVLAFVLYRATTSQPSSALGTTSSGSASASNAKARAAQSGRITEPLATAPDLAQTPPPTDEELRLIAELDPRGVYRKT